MKSKFMQLVLSSRPISWVNTMYPFAATYILLGHPSGWVLAVGTLYFLIPYNLLMYGINDVFDYESDLRNPRKVGMEGIILKPTLHKLTIISAVVLNLPFVVALIVLTNTTAAWVLLLIVFFVVAYSAPLLRFKERPFLDSATSSMHFVGPMLFAIAAAGSGWQQAWPFVLAFFCWGMASHAFGAVQDVVADKSAGLGSVATVIGAKQTVRFAMAMYALCVAVVLLQATVATTVVGLVLASYIVNIWPYRNVAESQAQTANRAWRRFIYLNYACGAVITITLILATGLL